MTAGLDPAGVDAWISGRAHDCFVVMGGLFGGGDIGHMIAGNFVLAACLIFTLLSLRFVFRQVNGVAVQVWEIGVTLLKIVIGAAIVLFLAVWTFRIYWFMYPVQAEAVRNRAAESLTKEAAGEGASMVLDAWNWVRGIVSSPESYKNK